jgi:hypothetical protein
MILLICISLPSGLRNVDALKRSCVSNYWNQAAKFNREKGRRRRDRLDESRLYNRSRTTRGAAELASAGRVLFIHSVYEFSILERKKKPNRTTTERRNFSHFAFIAKRFAFHVLGAPGTL